MRSIIRSAASFLDKAQRRFARSRPGSVLILVVVLVVLLSLLGTALLSTTRNDRYTSAQNTVNTQIDLLVDGVKNMCVATINGGLKGDLGTASIYRPPEDSSDPTNSAGTYANWDMPCFLPDTGTTSLATNDGSHIFPNTHQNEKWLAPRWPQIATNTGNPIGVMWESISQLPGDTSFDSPMVLQSQTGSPQANLSTNYTQRVASATGDLWPVYIQPAGYGGQTFPAWKMTPPSGGGLQYFLAADADGDGIADSALKKFSVGEIDGVTYYYAVRIVDNNSAINVNTARSRIQDYNFNDQPVDSFGTTILSGTNNLGSFRSHVGLLELLHSNGFSPSEGTLEMQGINRYRYNFAATFVPIAGQSPVIDNTGSQTTATSFLFNTQGDATEHQLARRTDYPGYRVDATSPTGYSQYQAFGISDASALAYHFTMINLDASKSPLETAIYGASTGNFADSIYSGAPNYDEIGKSATTNNPSVAKGKRAYQANQIGSWVADNFDFDRYSWVGENFTQLQQGNMPSLPSTSTQYRSVKYYPSLRTILTSSNPVSNEIAVRSMTRASTVPLLPDPATMKPYGKMTDPRVGAGTGSLHPYPCKTDINTADFSELYRAFWCVMAENNSTGSGTAYGTLTAGGDTYTGNRFMTDATFDPIAGPTGLHNQEMFRSPMRDPNGSNVTSVFMKQDKVLQLRAALAAINAQSLREGPTQPVLSKSITLPASVANFGGATISTSVSVYGNKPQPFITEIYINNDDKDDVNNQVVNDPNDPNAVFNRSGYVAIELFNPYDQDIPLKNFTMAVLDRRATTSTYGNTGLNYFYIHDGTADTTNNQSTANSPYAFPNPTDFVPKHGFAVLENYQATPTGNDAKYRPAAIQTEIAANNVHTIHVPNLNWVMEDAPGTTPTQEGRGGEFVLLAPTAASPARLETQGNAMPIDSYDFTGFFTDAYITANPTSASGHQFISWHYNRSVGTNLAKPNWRFVYPGRYDGTQNQKRQQGTTEGFWTTTHTDQDENASNVRFGEADPNPPSAPMFGASYPTVHTIQLFNKDFPGPLLTDNAPSGSPGYPFGKFMRNGDILQVPFIGSYVVYGTVGGNLVPLEVNAITIDSAFADDTDIKDDEPADATTNLGDQLYEQVGRFSPVRVITAGNNWGANDFYESYTNTTTIPYTVSPDDTNTYRWRYRWALDLFDYLTVQSPASDYLPNVLPTAAEYSHTPLPTKVENTLAQQQAADADNSTLTGVSTLTLGKEDTVPIQGLININTAPWPVLAALPWVPAQDKFGFDSSSGQFTPAANPDPNFGGPTDDNIDIAKAIVYWRDGDVFNNKPAHGPFKSIYDLNNVTVQSGSQDVFLFQAVQNVLYPGSGSGSIEPGNGAGDFAPFNDTDGVRYDFEEQFLTMNKVSNLITTRSDSFTVYVLVQGWTGVGTTHPKLVAQRRAAFIQDRSPVVNNPSSAATVTPVNND